MSRLDTWLLPLVSLAFVGLLAWFLSVTMPTANGPQAASLWLCAACAGGLFILITYDNEPLV
jgi:hypothetical protein